jgi:hypothetical protein
MVCDLARTGREMMRGDDESGGLYGSPTEYEAKNDKASCIR